MKKLLIIIAVTGFITQQISAQWQKELDSVLLTTTVLPNLPLVVAGKMYTSDSTTYALWSDSVFLFNATKGFYNYSKNGKEDDCVEVNHNCEWKKYPAWSGYKKKKTFRYLSGVTSYVEVNDRNIFADNYSIRKPKENILEVIQHFDNEGLFGESYAQFLANKTVRQYWHRSIHPSKLMLVQTHSDRYGIVVANYYNPPSQQVIYIPADSLESRWCALHNIVIGDSLILQDGRIVDGDAICLKFSDGREENRVLDSGAQIAFPKGLTIISVISTGNASGNVCTLTLTEGAMKKEHLLYPGQSIKIFIK